MKILIDMNLSPVWAEFLIAHGHEAIHWGTFGLPDAADSELMDWAANNSFVVLTNDLDFTAILAATGSQLPSVIQLRLEPLSPRAIGTTVLLAMSECRADLAKGALVSIGANRARVRVLPLR